MVPLTYVSPTTKILCDHIRRLVSEPAGDEEFTRAKNQLKSMVFMNLEQRSVYCEEIGQQFLSFNHHKPPEQWAKEIDLVKTLTEYPSVVAAAGENFAPSVIGAYVYELAKQFNGYYHDHSILREEDAATRTMRLRLAGQVARVIRRGMNLLGIDVPERM